MSDDDRFRGQDLYDEHDNDDDLSAMEQDQGGRVPDRDAGLDYAYTPDGTTTRPTWGAAHRPRVPRTSPAQRRNSPRTTNYQTN